MDKNLDKEGETEKDNDSENQKEKDEIIIEKVKTEKGKLIAK